MQKPIILPDKYSLLQKSFHLKKDYNSYSSRGYLPHLNLIERTQFVTFRLNDSLPKSVINKILEQTKDLKDEEKIIEKLKLVEFYLNCGYGSCILRKRKNAMIVCQALKFYHLKKYKLISWVVMPNHVHLMLYVYDKENISKIIQSIKVFTALKINRANNTTGQIWQREFFDRLIRSEKHYYYTLNYIRNNPVKAKLCLKAEDWEFSSSHGAPTCLESIERAPARQAESPP